MKKSAQSIKTYLQSRTTLLLIVFFAFLIVVANTVSTNAEKVNDKNVAEKDCKEKPDGKDKKKDADGGFSGTQSLKYYFDANKNAWVCSCSCIP